MPIPVSDVVVGGVYATATNQERRVLAIVGGKVHYESRSGNLKNPWGSGHIKSAPPGIEKFAADCERVISKPGTAGEEKD